jgi:uncharacterized iron-regulated membrane protein
MFLQVHRWVGLVAGLYVLVVSITGAALVFRIDLQRALFPRLFTAGRGPLADPVTVMNSVTRAYPDHQLSGVDAPTTTRPTYLAYVTAPQGFKTVLIDPATATVLGELPERSAVRALQDLHFDLLSGRTGRIVNGVGAVSVVVLAITGVVAWWPRRHSWRRWRSAREFHRAAGVASAAFILMWAITGAYFAFPTAFRSVIGTLSPLTVGRTPLSTIGDGARPQWSEVIDAARRHHPTGHVARVVVPFGERGSWLVMFSDRQPTPAYTELESVFVDQYSGRVIDVDQQMASAGDRLTRAAAPLHVGAFGGFPVRVAWFFFGLAPSMLALTGAIAWWRGGRR